jgi:hypothetical protein
MRNSVNAPFLQVLKCLGWKDAACLYDDSLMFAPFFARRRIHQKVYCPFSTGLRLCLVRHKVFLVCLSVRVVSVAFSSRGPP